MGRVQQDIVEMVNPAVKYARVKMDHVIQVGLFVNIFIFFDKGEASGAL